MAKPDPGLSQQSQGQADDDEEKDDMPVIKKDSQKDEIIKLSYIMEDDEEFSMQQFKKDTKKEIGFLKKLNNMVEVTKTYNEYFHTKKPRYEQNANLKRQRYLDVIKPKKDKKEVEKAENKDDFTKISSSVPP